MSLPTDVFIYVIAVKEGGEFKSPVKVGVSASPFGRLDALQTACPHDLGIVGVLSYPNREMARQMEDCFHQTHKAERRRGEWFDIEPQKALSIVRLQARFAIDMFTNFSAEEKAHCIAIMEEHL